MVPAVILRDRFKLNPVHSIQTARTLLKFRSVSKAQCIRQKNVIRYKAEIYLSPVLLCPPDSGRSKSLEEFSPQNTAEPEYTEN